MPKDIKYTADYYKERVASKDVSYRAMRRIREIKRALDIYKARCTSLLDIGTADGMLLQHIPAKVGVGIDISFDLLRYNKNNPINASALYLPFKDSSFDVVIASALLAHVKDPVQVLKEIQRIVKRDGYLIIITSAPFFVKIATAIGYLKKSSLNEPFFISEVKKYLEKANLRFVDAWHFMLNPFFRLPLESSIEHVVRALRLDVFMTNQLIIARK